MHLSCEVGSVQIPLRHPHAPYQQLAVLPGARKLQLLRILALQHQEEIRLRCTHVSTPHHDADMQSHVCTYLADWRSDGHHDIPGGSGGHPSLEVVARGPDGGLRGAIHVAQTPAAGDQRHQ